MGQYYLPVNIDKKEYVYSHDYENGLKLMEHSWIGNGFMSVVENLIAEGGSWCGNRIVWAGDYADDEPKSEFNTDATNWYGLMEEENKIKPPTKKRKFRYLVNLDNKEFVDMRKVPVSDVYEGHYYYYIHPLSLLTCEGNGRGGGDYRGKNKRKTEKLLGRWARKRITIQNEIPEGMTELVFDLKE